MTRLAANPVSQTHFSAQAFSGQDYSWGPNQAFDSLQTKPQSGNVSWVFEETSTTGVTAE